MALAASAQQTSVKLNNGVDMPVLAFGANVWDADTCKSATTAALEAGFRFIWSSALIGAECQKAQGEAIKAQSIKREDIFISGTVNSQGCGDKASCQSQTKAAAEQQFTTLGVTYLDMLMLDYPAGSSCDGIVGQWNAFSEIYAQKRVKTIAVSNFSPDQMKCILSNTSAVVPSVNQMQYSVGHGHDTVVADNAKHHTVVQAYSPLGSGNLATDPMCERIGKAHNKSAAQVALRWILQHNATINTQSTHLEYLQQDADIFDFELSPEDMKQLDAHT